MFTRKAEGSSLDPIKSFFYSKPVKTAGAVALVALAVLGGLTIAGNHFSGSTLSRLEDIFTLRGGYVMFGVGSSFIVYKLGKATCVKIRACCKPRKNDQSANRRENSANTRNPNRGTSGASTTNASNRGTSEHLTFPPLVSPGSGTNSNYWNNQPPISDNQFSGPQYYPYPSGGTLSPGLLVTPASPPPPYPYGSSGSSSFVTFPGQHVQTTSVPSYDVSSGMAQRQPNALYQQPPAYSLPPSGYGISLIQPAINSDSDGEEEMWNGTRGNLYEDSGSDGEGSVID